ncbi:MAG: hypothetical protein Q8Q11_03770 [bacterium]|nr:hypothetical protein [bacterium]MDZ4248337.1 hypothetical protein [Patescibacteria group bacterium]
MAAQQRNRNRIRTRLLITAGVAGLLVVAVVLYLVLRDDSVNHVQDESLGISFDIDKRFVPIGRSELARQNPSFIYGYRPAGDTSSGCYISQTPRTTGGQVATEYLEEGTMKAIRRNNPDAKLIGSETVEVEVDHQGVLMDISYQEQQQVIARSELVVTTDTATTFAFCDAPRDRLADYQENFTVFFSSLTLRPFD